MSRAAPTRSQVLALTRRLQRVARGAELLHRKREALVSELFRIARPALESRNALAEEARQAWADLLEALGEHGREELEALGLPQRRVGVEVTTRKLWGVEVPDVPQPPKLVRGLAMRDVDPLTMGPAAEKAATAFERLAEHLVATAAREAALERLGEQLVRTTRQVNALEKRVAPALRADLSRMRRVLDEREREDHLRLRYLARR